VDESAHEQIVLKTFPVGGQDVCERFFREIEFLIRLSHPCVLRIVGYFLATGRSGWQIGTEFAVNGSLREALDKPAAFLNDTGRAIVIAGVMLSG
jgi:hypothetical protein